MIKHLLEPPSEHGGIQFHRFNIESDSRLEGLIKISNWPPLRQIRFSPLSPLSPDVYRTPHRLTAGARPDPVPPTQHQERLLTRGSHQDVGSVQYPPTIYSSFFDALPVVKYWSENSKRLIHFSTREVLRRLLEAFSQRITLCDR
uniref:Uncharacterized protein n=1 Tax=Ananas comosus var. bracteatus TaxID=296719 RepID=A0A6V7QW07_ANACO